jgi:hypothetical protein
MTIEQGDPRLLETDLARRLLGSTALRPSTPEAAHRFLGPEQAAEHLSEIDQAGTRMARIAVRPTWVGLMDFQTRMPSALGGVVNR